MNNELLYNQLYERTKEFGRNQFIKELMRLERENNQLKEQYCERTDCGGRLGNSKKVERLIQENKELHNKIVKSIEDIKFCINGMKNEFACTDSRTNRELHTMVDILENTIKVLKDSDVDE